MEFNKPRTEGPRFSVKYVLTKQRVQLTCTVALYAIGTIKTNF